MAIQRTQLSNTTIRSTPSTPYLRLKESEKLESKTTTISTPVNHSGPASFSYNHYTKPANSLEKEKRIQNLSESGIKITKDILKQNGITVTEFNLYTRKVQTEHLRTDQHVRLEKKSKQPEVAIYNTFKGLRQGETIGTVFQALKCTAYTPERVAENHTSIKNKINSSQKVDLSPVSKHITTALDMACTSIAGSIGFGIGFIAGGPLMPITIAAGTAAGMGVGAGVSHIISSAIKNLIIKPLQKVINFTRKVNLYTSLLTTIEGNSTSKLSKLTRAAVAKDFRESAQKTSSKSLFTQALNTLIGKA